MHRQHLLCLLDAYSMRNPAELGVAERIRELALRHEDCFLRSCAPGHVTASAWIVSHDHGRFLLTHHRKLDRWLQLGGHADGDPDVLAVALREAGEESGLREFAVPAAGGSTSDGQPLPLDLDVHRIPGRAGEPAHEHHDIRYLLVAGPDQRLRISEESKALEWFELERLEEVAADASLLRLGRKARSWLRGGDAAMLAGCASTRSSAG